MGGTKKEGDPRRASVRTSWKLSKKNGFPDFGRTGRNLEQKNRNNRRGGNPKHKTSLKRVNRH